MKRKYLVITLYILFLAVLFEGTARIFFHIPQVNSRLMDHDLGWRHWWISRHKSSGEEIYYKFDVHDPTRGWKVKSGLRDMQVFDNKVLNSNSRGLRGIREYAYEKQGDITRILILGDSFTFGDEVSDHETYSYYLQEMLPETEIINLGVHGYGHDQMLILLQEEGIKYQPDIVILGFLPKDMSRNMLGFRDFAKPMFVLDDELVLKGVPVPTPEEVIKWDWLRPRIIDLFSALHHKARNMLGLYSSDMDLITAAILEEMANTSAGIRADPVFFYLPAGGDIFAGPGLMPGEKYLFSVCEGIGTVECFSARPHFAARLAQGETFKTVNHWGPTGHRAIAEAIRDYLVGAGHIPGQNGSHKQPVINQ